MADSDVVSCARDSAPQRRADHGREVAETSRCDGKREVTNLSRVQNEIRRRQNWAWVATDERGRLTRVKITDPSFLNWPGLIQAVPGNIIPDFPVINKSFNLSYSGNDR